MNYIHCDIKSISKDNLRKAIIHCIELIGLKNPEQIKSITENTYSHTNTKGKVRKFTAMYGWDKYKNWKNKNIEKEKKLYKVNGYYIIELNE
jgi:hypothetical protein